MEKIYRRIFVCKYESANMWAKNSARIFDKIDDDDLFLIYQISEGNRPAISKRYVDKLGKHAIVRDVSAMGDEDRWKLTTEDLLQYQSKDTYVYFLYDNDAFQFCAEQSLPFKSIKSFMTLTQACIAYNNAYNKYIQENKRKNERNEKKNKETGSQIDEAASEKRNSSVQEKEKKETDNRNKPLRQKEYKMIEKIPEEEKNNKTQEKNEEKIRPENKRPENKNDHRDNINERNKKEDPKKNTHVKVVDTDDAEMLGELVSTLENTEKTAADINKDTESAVHSSKESDYNNKQSSNRSSNNNKKNENNDSEETITYERTLEDIEKEIFSGEVKNETIVRNYTELDDAKAKTAYLTFERLKSGINKYLKIEIAETLVDNDYLMFVMAILKSYSFNEFAQSWQTLNSFEILLNEREYNYIKEEAEHFNKMCQMFYQYDKW